jgi:hypothetical protein
MRPGDIRVFQSGRRRALALAIGIWAEQRKSNAPIHIHITGTSDFHTTVTDDPESERHHRTLFRNMKHLLEQHNRWPFPPNGGN